MHHERADNGSVLAGCEARACKVYCVVKAIAPLHAECGEVAQIIERPAGVNPEGKLRGVRGHYQVLRQTSLQAEVR